VTPCPETRTSLLFIDTAGCGFYETSQGNETCDESYANFDDLHCRAGTDVIKLFSRKIMVLGHFVNLAFRRSISYFESQSYLV
jgi:hypothetical protein